MRAYFTASPSKRNSLSHKDQKCDLWKSNLTTHSDYQSPSHSLWSENSLNDRSPSYQGFQSHTLPRHDNKNNTWQLLSRGLSSSTTMAQWSRRISSVGCTMFSHQQCSDYRQCVVHEQHSVFISSVDSMFWFMICHVLLMSPCDKYV